MTVFGHPEFAGHERVVFCADEMSGLRAIIAIHSTVLGPAAGGCRMFPYASAEEALTDALRLSRAMTYKNALAGLPLGGGKSVIIADPAAPGKHERLKAFAAHVEAQAGSYWTAEDVGVGFDDIASLAEGTRYVFGTDAGPGDPSPFTARGVFQGLKAAVRYRLGRDDLAGLRVAVQGLGSVGWKLAEMLKREGAALVVADRDEAVVRRAVRALGAEAAAPEDIHRARVDVFAPCALGGVINPRTVAELDCQVVAGAANNQLAAPADGEALAVRGILFAPDFLVNAGGMLAVGQEIFAPGPVRLELVDGIYETAMEVFEGAAREGCTPEAMAQRLAERRIEERRRTG